MLDDTLAFISLIYLLSLTPVKQKNSNRVSLGVLDDLVNTRNLFPLGNGLNHTGGPRWNRQGQDMRVCCNQSKAGPPWSQTPSDLDMSLLRTWHTQP